MPNGFSTKTCMPLSSALIVASQWCFVGRATKQASAPDSAIAWSKSVKCGMDAITAGSSGSVGRLPPTVASRTSGDDLLTMPTSSASLQRKILPACVCPMNPKPTTRKRVFTSIPFAGPGAGIRVDRMPFACNLQAYLKTLSAPRPLGRILPPMGNQHTVFRQVCNHIPGHLISDFCTRARVRDRRVQVQRQKAGIGRYLVLSLRFDILCKIRSPSNHFR